MALIQQREKCIGVKKTLRKISTPTNILPCARLSFECSVTSKECQGFHVPSVWQPYF